MRLVKYLHNIILVLLILGSHNCLEAQADSTKRNVSPTTQPTPSTNNSTVAPIVRPIEYYEVQQQRPKRRRNPVQDSIRRALALQDSLRKVDSLARLNTVLGAATPTQVIDSLQVVTTPQNIPEVPMLQTSDNPFDILRGGVSPNDTTAQEAASTMTDQPSGSLLDKKIYSKNFLFWVFLITLTIMAFVVANARYMIRDVYSTMLSGNALKQIYKEPIGWGNISYMALYVLFWINAGISIFLILSLFSIKLPYSQSVTLLLCIGAVAGIFLLKHFVLYLIANIFPIEKEVKTYNFIILTAGTLLGLLLMPINIFIAYAPQSMTSLFIYLLVGIVLLVYLLRSVRSLSIASPYMIDNKFHFFVYLCAVEIAPLMIFVKILLNGMHFSE